MVKHLLPVLLFLLFQNISKAQCIFDINAPISVNDDIFVQGSVSGLVDDDLGSNQSLCGVKLNFKHEFVGNLQIDLISPSGQSITLVGPQQISNFTNGSEWNILFEPCANTVTPDPGIPGLYSNGSSWIIGANYSGSYYPSSGCLEDFNTGNANGIWQLHILNGAFYTGDIFSFSLIFCDDTGISCLPCAADAGLVQNNTISFCNNDPALAAYIPDIIFNTSPPNNTLYFYKYAIVLNGVIINIEDAPAWDLLPPGLYEVYGISYLQVHDNFISTYIGAQITDLQQMLDNQLICGKITSDSIQLSIKAAYDVPLKDVLICEGDTIFVGNNFYTQSQLINDTIQTNSGCDSIVNINLTVATLYATILLDTLDCVNKTVTLDTTAFFSNMPSINVLSYGWYDGSGNLLANSGSIQVSTADDYSLKVSVLFGSMICNYTFPAPVIEITAPPLLPVINNADPCAGIEFLLFLAEDTLRSETHWIFEGDPEVKYLSDSVILKYNNPGTYEVCVYGVNQCGNSDTLCMSYLIGPEVNLGFEYDSLTCDGSFEIQANGQNVMLDWAFDANKTNLIVSTGGEHVSGNIITPNEQTVLFYKGSVSGCDLFGDLTITNRQNPYYTGVHDTILCGGGRILYTIDHQESDAIMYYTLNNQSFTAPMTTNSNTIQIDVVDNSILVIDSLITPYTTCKIIGPDTFNIKVNQLPFAQFSDTIRLCNGFSADGPPVYDLQDFILNGDKSGNWNFSQFTGIIFRNDSIDLSQVSAGIFNVNYQTNSATLPCENVNYTLIFKISDCSCPATSDVPGETIFRFCNNAGIINLDSLYLPKTDVNWYRIDNSGFEILLPDNDLILDIQNSGDIVLMLKTKSDWNGQCPDSTFYTIRSEDSKYAGDDLELEKCHKTNEILILDDLLLNSQDQGSWYITPLNFPGILQGFNPSDRTLSIAGLGSGSLSLIKVAESRNVCPNDTAIINLEIHKLPVINISGTGYLDCSTLKSSIKISSEFPEDYTVTWSVGGNTFFTSSGLDSQTVNVAGLYQFNVFDRLTGCDNISYFEIGNFADSIQNIDYNVLNDCVNDKGSLFITKVTGGSAPFMYSVDMQEFTNYTQFYDLDPGLHLLQVVDQKKCKFQTEFRVEPNRTYLLDLGPDETIISGDSVFYSINFPGEVINDISIRVDGINYSDTSGYLKPEKSIVLEVTITDLNGCVYTDSKMIFVKEAEPAFIPNIFSPNQDGINDIFFIPRNPKITKIIQFEIYDRWGNHVFGRKDFPAGDESFGWDGRFNNRLLDPAVFVYYIRYTGTDNTEKFIKGNLTLIR